jgi:Xaa-Pro dipeptidase
LIDAGANFNGYAADITRTYARENGVFADLIESMHKITQQCVNELKPGVSYVQIHSSAYHQVAALLCDAGIVNLNANDMLETGIINTFYPHGIGHFLGLQVHDVAGHVSDDRGTPNPAPDAHPFLRNTRTIEARQVFTIEPGLYFINSLLADLKSSEQSKYINWNIVDSLRPFGGIRIEDNVIVHRDKNENMTRELNLN